MRKLKNCYKLQAIGKVIVKKEAWQQHSIMVKMQKLLSEGKIQAAVKKQKINFSLWWHNSALPPPLPHPIPIHTKFM